MPQSISRIKFVAFHSLISTVSIIETVERSDHIVAKILIQKNGQCEWRDENETSNFNKLSRLGTFVHGPASGDYVTRDNNSVGIRNKTFGIQSGPVRVVGDTYYVRQYIYTEFTPKELLPYIEMRKKNPNIYFQSPGTITYTGKWNEENSRRCFGLDIGTKTGVVHGCPVHSGNMHIDVIDLEHYKINRTDGSIITHGKLIASIIIKISTENPIQNNEIGTKYVGLYMTQYGQFRKLSLLHYFQWEDSGYVQPRAYVSTSFTTDNNTMGKILPGLGVSDYIPEYHYRLPYMFFPIGSRIKIIIYVDPFWYDYLVSEYKKTHPVQRSSYCGEIPMKVTPFIIYKTDNVSETALINDFSRYGVYRKRINRGERFEYDVVLDKHTKIVTFAGTFDGGAEVFTNNMVDDSFYHDLSEKWG